MQNKNGMSCLFDSFVRNTVKVGLCGIGFCFRNVLPLDRTPVLTHTHTRVFTLIWAFLPYQFIFSSQKSLFKQTSKINKKWQNTPLTRFCCVAAKSATFLQLRRLPHRSCDFRLLLRSPSDVYIHKHHQQQQQSQMF